MELKDWLKEIPEIKRKKPRLDEVNYHWVLRIINNTENNPNSDDILEWIKNETVVANRF